MACDCNITLNNTGTPSCQPIMGVTKKLILVPLVADDGTVNQIDLTTDTLDETYFTDLINQADASKRWYPLPLIDNVEDTKNDPIVETLNSTQNIIVQDGTRVFTGVLVKQSTTLLGKLESFTCKGFGAYIIDKDSNLIGSIDGDKLKPIAIDQNTWNPRLVKTTDTTVQKLQIDFEFAQTEKDENLRLISQTEAGVNLLLVSGLLDVNQVVSNEAVDGSTSTLTLDYGTALTKIKVKGAVLADFTLYNNTTPGAVIITSVTESADGVYDLVYPAQTASDSLTLTFAKNGYESVSSTYTV